jgi:hypothetical protein
MTSAQYVLSALMAFSTEGDAKPQSEAKLSKDVLDGLKALQTELVLADDIESYEWSGAQKKAKLQPYRSKIHDLYVGILNDLKAEVGKLVSTTGLAWKQARAKLSKQTQQKSWTHAAGPLANDKYAVALSEFLTAIHLYLTRHWLTKGLD